MQSADSGLNDTGTHFFHKYLVGKRNGSHASHTTGIQTFVTFADAFVIFGNGQHFIVLAVCQHKYGALDAAEEFFDNYRGTGLTEHTTKHFFQFLFGFFECRKDQYAFSCAKTVGFQHIGCFKGFKESESFFQIFGIDAFVAGGGDAMTFHETLGKLLTAFQLGTLGSRADDGDMLCGGVSGKVVVDTFYQRIFGTYHNHIYFFFQGESFQGREVGSFDSYILAYCTGTGITGGDKKFLYFRALGYFPCQSVLAAAAS